MKAMHKALLVLAGASAAIAAVNKFIFTDADRDSKIRSGDITNDKTFNESFYKWRYGKARYVEYGAGEPLLLIHGASDGGSLNVWKRTLPLLGKQYRVFAIDLPGLGFSCKPSLDYTAYLYASFLNDFIADCVKNKVSVVAKGGSAAFAIAGCAFKPELYNKLILIREPDNETSPIACCVRQYLSKIMRLPLYGTFVYNLLSSRAALGAERYIAAHAGGVGNKYPLIARFANHLCADTVGLLNKIKIPVHTINAAAACKLMDDPRLFYRHIKELIKYN